MINSKVKNLVFIDDDPINNYIMQTRLDASGYDGSATFFDSAHKALEYLNQLEESVNGGQPDMIFLDIKMPGMDGFEFLEAFKKEKLNIRLPSRIVMVSSSNNVTDRKRSMQSGLVAELIEKPLSVEQINRIAQEYLS